MIDCHCHLGAEEFDADLDDVVERAKSSGVKAIIVVAEFVDEQEKVLDIARKYPGFCFPSLGLHPIQVCFNFFIGRPISPLSGTIFL